MQNAIPHKSVAYSVAPPDYLGITLVKSHLLCQLS